MKKMSVHSEENRPGSEASMVKQERSLRMLPITGKQAADGSRTGRHDGTHTAQDGIRHSKKEDLKATDKLKRYIVSKERLDTEQNQDIMDVAQGQQHVIKIRRIHRIKHAQGKSADSTPQVESIMLSPNLPYRNSARSSKVLQQLHQNHNPSAVGTAPLLSQQDQRGTERRPARLSQDNRDESHESKTANLVMSPEVIKPIKIEELLLDQNQDKE